MVSFSNLVENTRTVAIDINGEDLHVTYKPGNLSPAFMSKMQDQIEDDDPEGFSKLFCEIVAEWTLEGPIGEGEYAVEHGQPVPVEPEYVSWVPGSILNFIVAQIGDDATPKSKKRSRR